MESRSTLNDKTIKKLQELTTANIDSSMGFEEAARVIDNGPIRSLFRDFSVWRARNANELQRYVAVSDGTPDRSGSWTGKFYQWWIEFRGMMHGGDEHAILTAAERGEDMIKEAYERALKEIPASPVSDVLHRQYREIKSGHDRIREMRDARKSRRSNSHASA